MNRLKQFIDQRLQASVLRDMFAISCGTSFAHIRNIAYGSKPCGEKLCIALERETGIYGLCEELRPDVDWQYLRGTDKKGLISVSEN